MTCTVVAVLLLEMVFKTTDEVRARRRAYYYSHQKESIERARTWYQANRGRAKKRQNAYNAAHVKEYKISKRRWRLANLEKVKKRRHEVYLKTYPLLRQSVYDKLGRKCRRCGIDDTRVLCIDHVNGGGKKERETLSPYTLLKRVLSDETNAYQILCQNCNWIKRHENREWGDRVKLAARESEADSVIQKAA